MKIKGQLVRASTGERFPVFEILTDGETLSIVGSGRIACDLPEMFTLIFDAGAIRFTSQLNGVDLWTGAHDPDARIIL